MSNFQRRNFLMGMGTCIALPLFESLVPSNVYAQEAGRRRLVITYMPNGFTTGYASNSSGVGIMPTHTLEELNRHNADLQILGSLHNPLKDSYDQAFQCGHQAATSAIFNAIEMNGSTDSFYRQKTWDQHIADVISADCPIPSMCMEIGPWRSNVNFQFRQFSYVDDNVPLEHHTDLQAVYHKLTSFGTDPSEASARDLQLAAQKRKVLDLVLPQVRTLKAKLTSTQDREKLDQYLTGLESIEERVNGGGPTRSCDFSSLEARAQESGSYGFNDRQELVYDMATAMLACDLTRVVLVLGGDNDWEFSGSLDGLAVSNWHGASHDHLDSFKAMERHTARGFSGFLDRLKSTDDLGKSLLERSAALYITDMTRDDDPHRSAEMSYVLAGQGDGLYKRGSDGPARIKSIGKDAYHLWYTMMLDFGLEPANYGNGNSYIPELQS